MKRVIVIAGGAIAAIFVIVAAVVIYVLSSLDTLIKEAVGDLRLRDHPGRGPSQQG